MWLLPGPIIAFVRARWKLYGLGLPDETLKKIYYQNALKLLPGIKTAAFPK